MLFIGHTDTHFEFPQVCSVQTGSWQEAKRQVGKGLPLEWRLEGVERGFFFSFLFFMLSQNEKGRWHKMPKS